MSPLDPLPALDETAEIRHSPSFVGRDRAARDAARRALAREAAAAAEADRVEEDRAAAIRAGSSHRPPGRRLTVAAACAVVILGAGTVSVALRGGAGSVDRSAGTSTDSTTGVLAARVDVVAAADAPAGPSVGSVSSASPSPSPAATPGAAIAADEQHGAVYEGGHVTLRGVVPTRAMADALRAKAVAVVGAANVTDEYVIDPAAPSDVDGRVRIADPVLFRIGSAELDPRYAPLLDAGAILMALNPKVVLLVVGHTDSTGSDETNVALSIARARSVVDHVKAKGGFDDSRFVVTGVGASQPIADNATTEGRRANRRIEVTILGLLDPTND